MPVPHYFHSKDFFVANENICSKSSLISKMIVRISLLPQAKSSYRSKAVSTSKHRLGLTWHCFCSSAGSGEVAGVGVGTLSNS